MKKIIYYFALFIFGWLFIGVELLTSEDGVGYDPFFKKYPTLRFKFSNPTNHGESDFREYYMLVDENKKEFRDLCYYRYGLEDISQCEDLFRPKN